MLTVAPPLITTLIRQFICGYNIFFRHGYAGRTSNDNDWRLRFVNHVPYIPATYPCNYHLLKFTSCPFIFYFWSEIAKSLAGITFRH